MVGIMQSSRNLFLLAALLVLTGATESAVRHLPPPLFRDNDIWETPYANLMPREERADDLDYRLSNSTLPQHYDIVLTTKVDEGIKNFSGIVTIDLEVVEETKSIVIHARQLTNFVAKIVNQAGGVSEDLNVGYESTREFLTLTRKTSTSFAKDTKWKLTVTYDGELRTDNGGFYLSTYTDVDGNIKYLATTQFESTNARHAFPCYDEPDKRATFTITINHSSKYTAISNMPVDQSASVSGKTVFQKTGSMSTYLVAFIVSDFVFTEGVLNNLPQRVFSRPGTQHDQEWALVSGMLIAERLAEYYGVEFALPKLDQAAIPDFAAGAMENWGLATYREEYLLYDKDTSTVNTQTNIANIIAHEYCHQWFGNLVSVKWWTYLWLKEGFATLFSYKATDAAYPEWGIWQQFHTGDYQSALTRDASNNPRPMTHYVQKPLEISQLYDTVSYAKAGSVLNMWNHALTDKVFQRGLHNYLTNNLFNSAVEDQLFSAIQTAALEENYVLPATIAEMMSSWSRQGGYPMLVVTRNYNDGSFTVEQETYFNDETHKDSKTWYIPINFAIQSNPDFRDTEASHYLLSQKEIKVTAPKVSKDDWLILNKQSTGYYRINYDDRNWNRIIDGLVKQPYKIHPRNRAQLMHDAYSFSASKRLSHSILLNLMSYLKKEDEYAPWSTANGIVSTYNSYLSGDKNYRNFQAFVADIVSGIYEKLGINDVPGEQHYQKYTRNVVINMACLAGIESCLRDTNNKLKAFVDKGTPIEPNLQSQIYCNGLKQSEDDVFGFMYNQLLDSSDQALRRTLITSLGCSQTESQIKKFIESSIDKKNNLRDQERPTLLNSAYSRGQIGLLASIEFLESNWMVYAELDGGFGGVNPLDTDIRIMSQYVVNKEQETKLLALVDKVKDSDKVSKNLEADVKSNIKKNSDWLATNRDPLMSWLSKYSNTKDGSASVTVSTLTLTTTLMLVISRLL